MNHLQLAEPVVKMPLLECLHGPQSLDRVCHHPQLVVRVRLKLQRVPRKTLPEVRFQLAQLGLRQKQIVKFLSDLKLQQLIMNLRDVEK